MSKTTKSKNVFARILTYILVVLLLLGLAGVVAYFVAKDEGVTFSVEYDGKRYYSGVTEANLSLSTGETYSFSVQSLAGENVDFSVAVSSNSENNFSFIYDGEFYDFYADDIKNNDYSAVFGLQKNESGFSLTLPEDLTVERAIETKYGGDIQLQDNLQSGVPYFVITVSDRENSLNLFCSIFISVSGVEIETPFIYV